MCLREKAIRLRRGDGARLCCRLDASDLHTLRQGEGNNTVSNRAASRHVCAQSWTCSLLESVKQSVGLWRRGPPCEHCVLFVHVRLQVMRLHVRARPRWILSWVEATQDLCLFTPRHQD